MGHGVVLLEGERKRLDQIEQTSSQISSTSRHEQSESFLLSTTDAFSSRTNQTKRFLFVFLFWCDASQLTTFSFRFRFRSLSFLKNAIMNMQYSESTWRNSSRALWILHVDTTNSKSNSCSRRCFIFFFAFFASLQYIDTAIDFSARMFWYSL